MAPRQIVNDLAAPPNLEPVARGVDSYTRPGERHIGPPPTTNSLAHLSAALAHLEPRLQQFTAFAQDQQTEQDRAKASEELAKAREAHDVTRGSFNALIGTGKILPGESPFVNRLADRLQLQQLGHQYGNEYMLAFQTSEDFAQARASNKPDALNAATQTFYKGFMDANGFGETDQINRIGDPYTKLDIQEVLTPMTDRAGNQVQNAWSQYRIVETHKDAVAAVGGSMSTSLQELALQGVHKGEDSGASAYSAVGTHLNALVQEGVKNGAMGYQDGNRLAVDTVVAHMEQSGDPNLKNVLMHMMTNNGKSSVGSTPYAVARVQAAEEHIVTKEHQALVNQEYLDNTSFRADSKKETQASWKRANESHEMALTNYVRTKSEADLKDTLRTGANEVFAAVNNGDSAGVVRILKKLRDVTLDQEGVNAIEKSVGDMSSYRHTKEVPPSDYNDLAVANFSAAIQADPTTFSRKTLINAMVRHDISGVQEETLGKQLTAAQERGGHEFMQTPEYKNAIAAIRNVIGKDPYDPANSIGQLTVPLALNELNVTARAYLDEHPKATQAQFQKYVVEQVTPIAKRYSETVTEQVTDREKSLKLAEEKQQAAREQAKKDEDARLAQNEKAIASENKKQKDAQPTNAPEPQGTQSPGTPTHEAATYPVPQAFHYRALMQNHTAANIAAFRKHFGPNALAQDDAPLQ